MGIFEGQPLRVLGRLLTFRAGGQTAPVEVSVEAPITPTLDLRRYLDLRSLEDGFAGQFFVQTVQNNHGAGGTVSTIFNPLTNLGVLRGLSSQQLDQLDVWHQANYIQLDNNVLTEATVYSVCPVIPGSTQVSTWLLGEYTAIQSNMDGATVGALARGGVAAAANAPWLGRGMTPFPIFRGASIGFTTTVTGAGIVQANLLFWFGARGSLPPGLA